MTYFDTHSILKHVFLSNPIFGSISRVGRYSKSIGGAELYDQPKVGKKKCTRTNQRPKCLYSAISGDRSGGAANAEVKGRKSGAYDAV